AVGDGKPVGDDRGAQARVAAVLPDAGGRGGGDGVGGVAGDGAGRLTGAHPPTTFGPTLGFLPHEHSEARPKRRVFRFRAALPSPVRSLPAPGIPTRGRQPSNCPPCVRPPLRVARGAGAYCPESAMDLDVVVEQAIWPAYALLPSRMDSDRATVMLLAIGLQESRFEHRRQIKGPARGFWQFERGGGVRGVMTHS